ncbi:MAG: S9 family peptidase, partial [Chloroflexi bacterium]|nr:S9 family peptidase [Chloroflexota bacterium]
FYDVGIYDLEGGAIAWVAESEWDKMMTDWSPDGRRIVHTHNRDGNVALVVKDLTTGATETHEVEPGVHLLPRFSPDGKHLLFLYAGARHPEDLWALDLATGKFRQLTQSLPPDFSPDDFVAPEMVSWQSDEWAVHGVLYRPERAATEGLPPGIVFVHGGPTWQWHNDWSIVIQHLVSHGFVVLSVNYRGSTGYGKAYQIANRFDLGGGDMRDVIRGAEYLAREGIADPKRLGITGASYGGYLTVTALTKYPKVFAAGSAVVPFLNWFTEHANEREDLQYWDMENFGDPVKDADRYREYSPIFFMDNVIAPLQLLAGENDPRCPPDEARQAADALAKLGRPHELVIYPGEGHGFAKVENRIDAYRRRAEFFIGHLKDGTLIHADER